MKETIVLISLLLAISAVAVAGGIYPDLFITINGVSSSAPSGNTFGLESGNTLGTETGDEMGLE